MTDRQTNRQPKLFHFVRPSFQSREQILLKRSLDENLSASDQNLKRLRCQWSLQNWMTFLSSFSSLHLCLCLSNSDNLSSHVESQTLPDGWLPPGRLLLLPVTLHSRYSWSFSLSNNLLVCVRVCVFSSILILYSVCKAPFVWAFIRQCIFLSLLLRPFARSISVDFLCICRAYHTFVCFISINYLLFLSLFLRQEKSFRKNRSSLWQATLRACQSRDQVNEGGCWSWG